MTRALKSDVRGLAARKGYELAPARRFLGIEWVIELWGEYQGRQSLVREARADQLAEAYGQLAAWLRVQPDRPAPARSS